MKRDPSIRDENKDRIIQLEQKVLHYKSEVTHYQAKMNELAQQIKKEQTRIHYLQNKLVEAQTHNIENYEKKISQLEKQLMELEVELEEEKTQTSEIMKRAVTEVKEVKIDPVLSVQAHFSYSTILPSEDETHVSLIGDFVITNSGNQPLHDFIICIRISPKEAGKMSGKIVMNRKNDRVIESDLSFIQWEFVHENWMERVKETGEYWLKPVGLAKLTPNDSISFSSFEARLQKPEQKNVVILDGFVYCSEIKSGTRALNNIVINF